MQFYIHRNIGNSIYNNDDEEEKEYSQTSHSSNDEDYSYVESE
jgi:hypothetical protein